MRRGVLLLVLLFCPIYASAGFFWPDNPPGVAPGAVCFKTGCNMSGDIWMNGNALINVTLYDVNLVNATGSFSWNNLQDIPEGFADNIDNDTKYYDLNEFTNTPGYITDGNTNWDNSYGFITDGNTLWDNIYGFITGVDLIWTNITGRPENLSQFNNDVGYITSANISDNWVNETGDKMTGNLNMTGYNITDLSSVGFMNNASYFTLYDNGTVVTLQLWVNGELQQDWGASTTIYKEATFLDSIFGDSSTLLNVCLPSGLTVNGLPCNATSVFNTDEIWINNINGNATFNESKLNKTISSFILVEGFDGFFIHLNFENTTGFDDFYDNDTDYCKDGNCGPLNITGDVYQNGNYYLNGSMWLIELNASLIDVVNLSADYINALNIVVGTINATNMTVDMLSASVIFADEFFINGSVEGLCQSNGTGCPEEFFNHSEGAGKYLYNVKDGNKTNIYINESALFESIDNRTGIFELNISVNVIGGIGYNMSIYNFPRLSEILEITSTPTSPLNRYRLNVNGTSTGTVIDKDRIVHVGEWNVGHRGVVIQGETITATIIDASIDELFNINIKWRQ